MISWTGFKGLHLIGLHVLNFEAEFVVESREFRTRADPVADAILLVRSIMIDAFYLLIDFSMTF